MALQNQSNYCLKINIPHVETQSNKIKLKSILYEVKSVESLAIVVDVFVLCSPKCVMYVFLKSTYVHGAVMV